MEAEILRDMIADRDQRIGIIEKKSQDQLDKQKRLEQELDDVRYQNSNEKITFQTEKTRSLHQKATTEEQLEIAQRDLHQQGASLSKYANIIQLQDNHGVDSSYVMKMQAQLCKAMHSMGIVDHQYELVKEHCDSMIKFQKEMYTRMTEEKSQLELQLLNGMMAKDSERRELENELKEKLNAIFMDIKEVRREIEDNKADDEDESEVPDEETGDEKAAKEELMLVIKEKKEEIERLQSENEKQLETILDLRARVEGATAEEIKEKAEARREEKEKAKDLTAPPSPQKKEKDTVQAVRVQIAASTSEDDEDDDTPQHVPLANEEVLAVAKRRAEARTKRAEGDVDEFDLLNLARMRLTGAAPKNEDESEDEENDDEDEDEEHDDEDEDEDIEDEFGDSYNSVEDLNQLQKSEIEASEPVEEDGDILEVTALGESSSDSNHNVDEAAQTVGNDKQISSSDLHQTSNETDEQFYEASAQSELEGEPDDIVEITEAVKPLSSDHNIEEIMAVEDPLLEESAEHGEKESKIMDIAIEDEDVIAVHRNEAESSGATEEALGNDEQ